MSLDSHDQSLKHLLSLAPLDFLRFGLACPSLRVLRPTEVDLPVRARQTDGGYLIERDGLTEVGHIEFYRRHQPLAELALDICEAQVRFRRREGVPVVTMMWDLYGSRRGKLLTRQAFYIGRKGAGTKVVYVRVNLRALSAAELLSNGPANFYPLTPLTRDGAAEQPIRSATVAIEGRTDLTPGQRADHLAVLHFLAESENLPSSMLELILSEEKLMDSPLYQRIFNKGEAKGEARRQAEDLIRILLARLGSLDPTVKQIIRGQQDMDVLSLWFDEAIRVLDADAASKLVHKIVSS